MPTTMLSSEPVLVGFWRCGLDVYGHLAYSAAVRLPYHSCVQRAAHTSSLEITGICFLQRAVREPGHDSSNSQGSSYREIGEKLPKKARPEARKTGRTPATWKALRAPYKGVPTAVDDGINAHMPMNVGWTAMERDVRGL